MAKGKQTCKILKEIRKQIAAENDIELITSECTYKGDCLGTCPKCEEEVRYLERELEKRQRLGKVAVFAGMSLGTMFAATSCDTTQSMTEKEPLAGDVVAVKPVAPMDSRDSVKEVMMGKVALLELDYPFDAATYQQSLKKLFVFPKMDNLSIDSGVIHYEHIGMGEAYTTLEKLVAAAKEFRAPYFPDGEQKMLEILSTYLTTFMEGVDKYKGEMEVAFTVDRTGAFSDIVVQKGIDEALDAQVVSFLEPMKWQPANYQLNGERKSASFDCRCVLKIQFPITFRPEIMGEPPYIIDDTGKK